MKNNPFALVKSSNAWRGKIKGSGRFESFGTMKDGVRAGFINLYNVNKRAETLKDLIFIYAPPFENDSARYSQNMETWTGLSQSKKANLDDEGTHLKLGRAIIRQEGIKPGPNESEILEGFKAGREQLGFKSGFSVNTEAPEPSHIVSEIITFAIIVLIVYILIKFLI